MSDNVVSLDSFRPHADGKAKCSGCRHEWQAVVPIGTFQFECPECHSFKGHYCNEFMRGDTVWECNCGNDVFRISPKGIYCTNCGAWADGFK